MLETKYWEIWIMTPCSFIGGLLTFRRNPIILFLVRRWGVNIPSKLLREKHKTTGFRNPKYTKLNLIIYELYSHLLRTFLYPTDVFFLLSHPNSLLTTMLSLVINISVHPSEWQTILAHACTHKHTQKTNYNFAHFQISIN